MRSFLRSLGGETGLAALLLAIPCTVMFVGRTVVPGSGPRSAVAATGLENEQVATLPERSVPAPSQEDAATAALLREVASRPLGASPMRVPGAPSDDGSTQSRVEVTASEFTLGSILSARGRHLAVINGRPRGEGDTVRPGWVVASIDVEQGAVVLRSSAGQTLTLRLRNR